MLNNDDFDSDPDSTESSPALNRVGNVNRSTLILDGVCTNCAHCAMKLTDSDSIRTGMGPSCRKKAGYTVDPPTAGDPMQALISLANYHELVKILEGKNVRDVVNKLVVVCSLNRKSDAHKDICDAIEALGYASLASKLRESLCSVKIVDHAPGVIGVWVHRREFHWDFVNALKYIEGSYFDRTLKMRIIPVEREGVKCTTNGRSNKVILWEALKQHYTGLIMKVQDGKCVKIG